ncbi:ketosynthase chain-length factor [Nocardiopsis dassonvillei]|uniref:ketosynthase chain-length factor n=1 Tax=Nocardiopsis dassonvillei TaxID=2014 RepID=UPI003639A6D5
MSGAPVVTGIGVTAPTGLSPADHWSNTISGRSGIRRVTRFDPTPYSRRLAGEVNGFDAEDLLPSRLLRQTDRMTQWALVTADRALADAGIVPADLDEYSTGVVTASSAGGFEFGHRELQELWSKGPAHVSAYQSFAWFYAVNTGQISIRHGTRGSGGVLVTGQPGGLDAVAQARRLLRGGLSVAITGGVDGSLSPWTWVAELSGGQTSPCEDPGRAYLPFDVAADGHVPGEGGALFVLESEDSARARAAEVYGRVVGYGATFDPPPESGRPPTLLRAAELALDDAGLGAADVGVVFADAAAVPELDAAEATALRTLFGDRGVPVTAPKTLTGRLAAGGAALDMATALLSLRKGLVPPTANVTRPVPEYGLDLVTEPRPLNTPTALVLARGRGGFNAVLLLTR